MSNDRDDDKKKKAPGTWAPFSEDHRKAATAEHTSQDEVRQRIRQELEQSNELHPLKGAETNQEKEDRLHQLSILSRHYEQDEQLTEMADRRQAVLEQIETKGATVELERAYMTYEKDLEHRARQLEVAEQYRQSPDPEQLKKIELLDERAPKGDYASEYEVKGSPYDQYLPERFTEEEMRARAEAKFEPPEYPDQKRLEQGQRFIEEQEAHLKKEIILGNHAYDAQLVMGNLEMEAEIARRNAPHELEKDFHDQEKRDAEAAFEQYEKAELKTSRPDEFQVHLAELKALRQELDRGPQDPDETHTEDSEFQSRLNAHLRDAEKEREEAQRDHLKREELAKDLRDDEFAKHLSEGKLAQVQAQMVAEGKAVEESEEEHHGPTHDPLM